MHNKEMSSEYTPSSGRRSSRRGGRSRNGGRSRGPRNRQENSTSSVQAPPKKKTFWQKIVSIFTGDSKPAASSRPAPSNGAARSSERPARAERAERPEREERPTGFRKPEIIEVTSPRIYVGNLSFDAAESDLFELFNGVGLVQNVEIVTNKHTEKSKGFAFVQMQSVEEAKRAVTELHDKEYMGRKLVVSGAKAADERRSAERQQRQPEQ